MSSRNFPTRLALFCLLLTGLLPAAYAAPSSGGMKPADWTHVMAGDYVIVGRRPDSAATYTGTLVLKTRGDRFAFTRTVDGHTERGIAVFTPPVFEGNLVLRMDFQLDGRPCSAIYQWHFDNENDACFTGFSHHPDTKVEGMEAWFPAARFRP